MYVKVPQQGGKTTSHSPFSSCWLGNGKCSLVCVSGSTFLPVSNICIHYLVYVCV